MVVVAAILGAFTWHSLTQARTSLNSARAAVDQLESNKHELLTASGRAAAGRSLAKISEDAAAADQTLRSSIGLKVFGWLPVLHTQRQGLLDLASDVHTTATTGDQLLSQVNAVVADSQGSTVSITQLENLRAAVDTALTTLRGLNRPSSGLIGSLGDARTKFDNADATFVNQLDRGQQIISYALPFLGANGPRSYLLVGENNAEMRDQGAVLSVGTLQTQDGKITVVNPTSVGDLTLKSPANYAIPAGMQQVFGGYQPTQVWQSANATAGFPWTGGDLQAMYAQATGQHVNGVLALDVPAVASLLQLTGPVTVPGIAQPITAANVSGILLNQLYNGIPANTERHDELTTVARAVVDRLSNEKVDLATLANTLSQDVAGRHLLVWDEVPSYQATLVKFGGSRSGRWPGRLQNLPCCRRERHRNQAGLLRHGLGLPADPSEGEQRGGRRHGHHGGQPRSRRGRASDQLGPDNVHSFQVGQYVANAYLWGPAGAGIVQAGSTFESGLNVTPAAVSVLPQQQTTVTFKTMIPNAVRDGKLTLSYVPQPRLTPETVSATVQATGWKLGSQQTLHATLTKTQCVDLGIGSELACQRSTKHECSSQSVLSGRSRC